MRSARTFAAFCALLLLAFPALTFADTSFTQLLGQLEQEYNLPSGILAKVAYIESGGNATICAATSSACGMFQWTVGSWESATKALYGQPESPLERSDPAESARITAFELSTINTQIGSVIAQAKVNLTVGLYLGHFLGSGGARELLVAYMQNPAQSACALLPKSCAANRSVLSQSVSQVINYFAQKLQAPGVIAVAGNFQNSQGVSYAYTTDMSSSNFLPANTVITPDSQYDYPTVYTSVTGTPLSPTTGTGTALPTNSATQPNYTSSPTTATVPSTSTASSSGACTPQYYCSNNIVYYESDSCATSTFQMCENGCLGTICAPEPSASGTSSSVVSNVQPVAGSVAEATGQSAATTPFSLDSIVNTIVQALTPTQTNGTSSTSVQSGANTNSIDVTPTFTENGSGGTGALATAPEFSQILNGLKAALTGLLGYLQTL